MCDYLMLAIVHWSVNLKYVSIKLLNSLTSDEQIYSEPMQIIQVLNRTIWGVNKERTNTLILTQSAWLYIFIKFENLNLKREGDHNIEL